METKHFFPVHESTLNYFSCPAVAKPIDKTSSLSTIIEDDIFDGIFQKLPLNSLFKFMCVSKRWRSSIRPYIHKRLDSNIDHLSAIFEKFHKAISDLVDEMQQLCTDNNFDASLIAKPMEDIYNGVLRKFEESKRAYSAFKEDTDSMDQDRWMLVALHTTFECTQLIYQGYQSAFQQQQTQYKAWKHEYRTQIQQLQQQQLPPKPHDFDDVNDGSDGDDEGSDDERSDIGSPYMD